MGLSSSSVRFLGMTRRKNEIGLELMRLANDKVSLSRDAEKVSLKYQNALSQKTLKWSNNQGVSYTEINYSNIMRPSAMNQNKPYLLTDNNGKVVLDNKYKNIVEKYISPDGKAGGKWDESTRLTVLSEVCGFKATDLENYENCQQEIWKLEFELEKAKHSEPILEIKTTNHNSFLGMLSNNNSYGIKWGDKLDTAYALGGRTSAMYTLNGIVNAFKKAVERFTPEELVEKLEDACEAFLISYSAQVQGNDGTWGDSLNAEHNAIGGSEKDGYTLNLEIMVETILGPLIDHQADNGVPMYKYIDKEDDVYKDWVKAHKEWETLYNQNKADLTEAIDKKNMIFTADQETLIEFYDNIFSTIADKGWVYNNQVKDPEYLNQMLQNNIYTITETNRAPIEEIEVIDCGKHCDNKEITIYKKTKTFTVEKGKTEERVVYENSYFTDIASNFSQIFFMNDNDLRQQAQVEYEHEKRIIEQKESRIDTRMQNLQTEQAAINQMLQSIDKVKNENIERTMNIFG